jgi:hypothetical protein
VSDVDRCRVDNELWDEFHRVVNMPIGILGDWLRIVSSDPDWERTPDPAGMWTGFRVLNILRKSKDELDDEDIRVMRRVVDQVRAESQDVKAAPVHGSWLRRMLSIGHDPVRAA